MVEAHRIAYYEKTLGQLFCQDKARDIVNMLLRECAEARVSIKLKQCIETVEKKDDGFSIRCDNRRYRSQSVVVASGGLSIPTMGASPFAYQLAKQFGLKVYPTRAGLVPFTLQPEDKSRLAELAGVSVDCEVECNGQAFREMLLFTHRGLSGPAMLQISSYWQAGYALSIHIMPEIDWLSALLEARSTSAELHLKTWLSRALPKRLLDVLLNKSLLESPIKRLTEAQLIEVAATLSQWQIKPNGTEGYRTAEVTLGGVDCDEVSSKTFEAHKVTGLYFIGEALDVSGWLGGYNFQWAWSSGWACGQKV